MQTRNFYFGWVMVALSLFSCRKETSIENSSGLSGDFTAQINGTQWIAANGSKGVLLLQGMFYINGISVDGRQLSINLTDTVPGVYTLSPSSSSSASFSDTSSIYTFSTTQGSDSSQSGGVVTVMEVNTVEKTISGTFSFKVYSQTDNQQKTITAGVFYKLPYTTTSITPSGPGGSGKTDTLTAAIDGKPWIGSDVSTITMGLQLTIVGLTQDQSQSIEFILPPNIQAGSYTLDYTGGTYIGVYNPASTISLASSNGTLVILQNDVNNYRMRGKFQFQAVDPVGLGNASHSVTNGFFSVYYGP